MASTRNNSIQDRRTALRERQRRERTAADAVFKALEAEEAARVSTAAAIFELVDVAGAAAASAIVGLEPRELGTYVNLHIKLNPTTDDAPEGDAASDEADGSDASAADDATAGQVPTQGGQAVPVGAGS